MKNMQALNYIEKIDNEIGSLRNSIINHSLYKELKTINDLQIFMKHHVFAVWDFMSLLKALQNELTCTRVPWSPIGKPELRHFINEIVLGEESDIDENGNYYSHFEMYLKAMKKCGADSLLVEQLICEIESGKTVKEALKSKKIDQRIQKFVSDTFDVIFSNKPHIMAGVFAYGREELIPDMFSAIINDMYEVNPNEVLSFKYYLERHIEIDGEKHGELSRKLLISLCDTDAVKWAETQKAIVISLKNRIRMWDTVLEEILKK
jgi:hypothetical protein